VIEGIRNIREWGGGDPFNMPVGNLASIAESEWSDPTISQSAKNAILSFMLACGAAGRADVMADLKNKVMLVPGLAEELSDVFRTMDAPLDAENDIYIIVPSIVGRLLSGEAFDTNDIFLSAIYALQFLEQSVLAAATAKALMSFYEQAWPQILKERAFSMRSPSTNGPIILEAMRKGETAMQRMANMALATEAAARRRLSDDLRERFSQIAARLVRKSAAKIDG
jgi:hypothetical protein